MRGFLCLCLVFVFSWFTRENYAPKLSYISLGISYNILIYRYLYYILFLLRDKKGIKPKFYPLVLWLNKTYVSTKI